MDSSFILFFPFAFLTTSFVPKEQLTGWLSSIATYNPVTYVLGALRSLVTSGWDAGELAEGVGAIAVVGLISFFMALAAFRGRLKAGA